MGTDAGQQWEYKAITLARVPAGDWVVEEEDWKNTTSTAHVSQTTFASDYVQKLGEEGWELTTAYSAGPPQGAWPIKPTLVFKRRKP
jgi:hypothetical protein